MSLNLRQYFKENDLLYIPRKELMPSEASRPLGARGLQLSHHRKCITKVVTPFHTFANMIDP